MPPSLGFNFNRGANYVPCIVTDNRGRGVLARYTRVIMGPDPHIIGIIPGDSLQYGGPLYAVPDHDQEERPRYAQDNLWRFKYSADDFDRFESALEHIGDLSLTAEVMRYHEASCLFFQYQEEICKSKSTCGKPASSKTQVGVGWRELMLYTGSKKHWWIWIEGQGYITGTLDVRNVGIPPVTERSRNAYYTDMTNVSK